MANLPEQAHAPGAAVATRPQDDPYALDERMVTLPSLYFAQYGSKAFKARRAGYGDIYVGVGAEDTSPMVVASGGEPLSAPVRFYVHRVLAGYQLVDATAAYGKRSLRPGTSYNQALAEAQGDPTKVFQQTLYTLTVPAYPILPVRFIASGMSQKSARWLNTQIGILRQQDIHPLTKAFQVQTRQSHNDSGDFLVAEFGFADVKAKDASIDQELVEKHAALLASTQVSESYGEPEAEAVNAPSLD